MCVQVKYLGLQDYTAIWRSMREFTDQRSSDTQDEIWLVEHHPVYTQGQAGKTEHVLNPGSIPVIQTDRGGQVTYHGPGQLVIYPLLNIRRLHCNVRDLVTALENAVIELLKTCSINATARADAPGVYVEGKKLASLGLRIRKGYSYHGVSINVNMDLEPFSRINPCGYQGLEMTQLRDFIHMDNVPSLEELGHQFVTIFTGYMKYTTVNDEVKSS